MRIRISFEFYITLDDVFQNKKINAMFCTQWSFMVALKFNLLILSRGLWKVFEARIFLFLFVFSKEFSILPFSVCSVSGIRKRISTKIKTAKGHKESNLIQVIYGAITGMLFIQESRRYVKSKFRHCNVLKNDLIECTWLQHLLWFVLELIYDYY